MTVLLQRATSADPVKVDYLKHDETVEVSTDPDGTSMAKCVYTFDVIAEKYGRDEPATIRPAKIFWSDVGTGERKSADLLVLPSEVMAALADCEIALDMDRRA